MANKVIAVQEGLHDIAKELKNLGYEVVGVDETNHALDVIIYSSKLSGSPTQVRQKEDDFTNKTSIDSDGMVFMMNADEYSMKELITRINDI